MKPADWDDPLPEPDGLCEREDLEERDRVYLREWIASDHLSMVGDQLVPRRGRDVA